MGARLLQPGRLVDSAGVVDIGVEAQTRLPGRVDVGAADLVEGIETMIGVSHHRAETRHLHRGETRMIVETDGLRRAQGVRREGEGDMIETCGSLLEMLLRLLCLALSLL